MARPVRRTTARVLPVRADGAVLLVQELDTARPRDLHWASIGGGVDAGESLAEAAVRELREETGLVASATQLVGPFHDQHHDYSFDGVSYRAHSHYFALAAPDDVEVSLDHLMPDEVGTLVAADWWTPDDLDAGVPYADPGLPHLLRAAVALLKPS